MIQQSIYCKLCLNQDQVNQAEKRLQNIMPKRGNIRTMSITEKQYQNIKIHVGSKTNNEIIMNDRRFQEI